MRGSCRKFVVQPPPAGKTQSLSHTAEGGRATFSLTRAGSQPKYLMTGATGLRATGQVVNRMVRPKVRVEKERLIMSRIRRNAFTLIEVLIVVVIMAVLAATVIPQFTASHNEARESSLLFNTHTLQTQIELYKMQHIGNYPTITALSLPQLTSATNASGTIGTGVTFPYGPYIVSDFPTNPFNNSSNVVGGTGASVMEGGAGWQYNASTGGIWPNNSEYFD